MAALDETAPFWGVMLVGDIGVGKSTLAQHLADIVASRGITVRFVLGTETGRAVPLGAFHWLGTLEAAGEPAAMLATAQRILEQEKSLVIVVDDAQLLDPLSATLVCRAAACGNVRLIATMRSGTAVTEALAALWKERLLLNLHIDAFTWQQTKELACAVLGEPVENRLVDELHDRTAGNPLMLRGLLRAGRETGVLMRTKDGWQLRGALHPDRELYGLLEFRLQSLAPEELEAVELIAAAEVVDWEILRGICDTDAVGRLERRGIIQLVADKSHTVARLFHPILGEVALQSAGVVRSRQLNGMMAHHLRNYLQAEGQRSRPDVRIRIQLAQFMMRSDLTPDVELIVSAAASALGMGNIDCAEKLARFALDQGGGLPAAIVLAKAMGWQGRSAEVEAMLAGIDPDGPDNLVTAHGCLRAMNLFCCGQIEHAWAELANVRNRVKDGANVGFITAVEVLFAYFSGDVSAAIDKGLALCEGDVPPVVTAWAAAPTCWALALSGRYGDVHRIADAGLRAAVLGHSEALRLIIGVAEIMAFTTAGDFSFAERVWQRYVDMPAGATPLHAPMSAMLGLVNLARGAVPSACTAFQNSLLTMSGGSPFSWLMVVAAWSAQAEGARGNNKAAAAALRSSEAAYGPQIAVYLPELELARAWEKASLGETTAARMHTMRAAEIARRYGMSAVEMRALHTAVRFGDQSCAARLEELARTLKTPLAEAIADHARGIANRDGDLLDVAAGRFADMGALALAADAAAQAALEHARKAQRGKQVALSARAYGLASQCGLRTPAVATAARPLPITGRERQIAMLVAEGLSNRQIADRLFISVRTTERHLYRIFTKLGINSRNQLTYLLPLDRSGAQDLPLLQDLHAGAGAAAERGDFGVHTGQQLESGIADGDFPAGLHNSGFDPRTALNQREQ